MTETRPYQLWGQCSNKCITSASMPRNILTIYTLECNQPLWFTWHIQKWNIVWEATLHVHIWPHGDSWFVAEWMGWCWLWFPGFVLSKMLHWQKSWHLWKILWSILTLWKLWGWLFLSINIFLQKCSVFVCCPHGEINNAFCFIYLDIFNFNQSSEIRQQDTVAGLHEWLHFSFICRRLQWCHCEVDDSK